MFPFLPIIVRPPTSRDSRPIRLHFKQQRTASGTRLSWPDLFLGPPPSTALLTRKDRASTWAQPESPHTRPRVRSTGQQPSFHRNLLALCKVAHERMDIYSACPISHQHHSPCGATPIITVPMLQTRHREASKFHKVPKRRCEPRKSGERSP